jgi:beta-galactosidase
VHVENAQIVAAYASEFYEGMPALTVNTHGAGQAYYIAPRTDEAFLDAFYGRLIERAGLANGVFTAPTGVSIQMRESDTMRCWFVMNFTAEEQTVRVNEAVIDALSKTPIHDSLLLTPYDIAVVMQPKSSSQEVES